MKTEFAKHPAVFRSGDALNVGGRLSMIQAVVYTTEWIAVGVVIT